MVKKVPYTEMRFFFCTHVWVYDLPTQQPTLWGQPPRWQLIANNLLINMNIDEQESCEYQFSLVVIDFSSFILVAFFACCPHLTTTRIPFVFLYCINFEFKQLP